MYLKNNVKSTKSLLLTLAETSSLVGRGEESGLECKLIDMPSNIYDQLSFSSNERRELFAND